MSKPIISTILVSGFEPALMGMRNPMNSWEQSDSIKQDNTLILIGEKDMRLAKDLVKAGAEHCKFLRQIQVWANMEMPRYWWSEMDTYHFNSKNSCSTMHTIMKEPISEENFYIGKDPSFVLRVGIQDIVRRLNALRESYLNTKDYQYVIEMKRLLPESFLQMRTVNTNYAELMNVYWQRRNHRLRDEWIDCFCKWCESLPYFIDLCIKPKEDKLNGH